MRNMPDMTGDIMSLCTGHLPTLCQFRAITPKRLTAWNFLQEIWSTSAILKALGFSTGYGPTHMDGTIEFNAYRNWDYSRGDGVVPPAYDFQAALTHEIAHVLGFQSSIDAFGSWFLVDKREARSEESNKPFPNANVAPMALDMFRFGLEDLPSSATEFSKNARNLNSFEEDIAAAYLLLDTSTWAPHEMEPGDWVNQDQTPKGKQASHWINRPTGSEIGIMDAVMHAGLGPGIKDPDWQAMDVIGWDVVAKSTGGGVLWNGSVVPPSSLPAPPSNLRIIRID